MFVVKDSKYLSISLQIVLFQTNHIFKLMKFNWRNSLLKTIIFSNSMFNSKFISVLKGPKVSNSLWIWVLGHSISDIWCILGPLILCFVLLQAKSEGSCKAVLWALRPMASIFYRIWIKQSVAMVFIFILDKVSLKKLFPTMNI